MSEFTLEPNPTFWAKAEIHVPGGDPMLLEVEYRYLARKELTDLRTRMDGKPKLEMLNELVVGWKAAKPFSAEALASLDDRYYAAADALLETYLEELTGARRKNS